MCAMEHHFKVSEFDDGKLEKMLDANLMTASVAEAKIAEGVIYIKTKYDRRAFLQKIIRQVGRGINVEKIDNAIYNSAQGCFTVSLFHCFVSPFHILQNQKIYSKRKKKK